MSNMLIKIGDIEKFSIVDFPNKIACVVFMQGCPWKCPFCYNQSLQNPSTPCSELWSNLVNLLNNRKGILDAVVFSGGEPLLQPNLLQAMNIVKDMGYAIGLHTGGYNPKALLNIINIVDWVGLDIKSPLENERYYIATGSKTPVENIKESLKILLNSNVNFECRTTCDPRILNIDDIYRIADKLSSLGVKEYHLQKYRPIPTDTTTTENDCDKFFNDNELENYLRNKFDIFSARK